MKPFQNKFFHSKEIPNNFFSYLRKLKIKKIKNGKQYKFLSNYRRKPLFRY